MEKRGEGKSGIYGIGEGDSGPETGSVKEKKTERGKREGKREREGER